MAGKSTEDGNRRRDTERNEDSTRGKGSGANIINFTSQQLHMCEQ